MIKIIQGIKIIFIVTVFIRIFFSPITILAKTCYVDNDESGGKGTSSEPYGSIAKALDKKCDNIKLSKGKYQENITLNKGSKLIGKGNRTIITGKIIMKDKSELKKVLVKNLGIEVFNNASVNIDDIRVEKARIGITTNGGGKLILRNSVISYNGKGLYLRYGKNIDIRNNVVTHNNEEGVDIRANVDGIIDNNQIRNNKEGGIEVIAGKSQLIINNNDIEGNTASGIAVQFYKENKSIGNLKIFDNKLVNNGNYGLDCKIPSGGKPADAYWSKSVHFQYNVIKNNHKGNFGRECDFSDDEILQATKTEEEIEEDKLQEVKQNKEQSGEIERQNQSKEELTNKKETNREEIEAPNEEINNGQEIIREDLKLKEEIDQEFSNYEKQCYLNTQEVKVANYKKKWGFFYFHHNIKSFQKYDLKMQKCQMVIGRLDKKITEIKTQNIRQELKKEKYNKLQEQLQKIKQVRGYYFRNNNHWQWFNTFLKWISVW